MSADVRFGSVEEVVKLWLQGSEVAPLVTRPDGTIDIYLSMPKSSPIPVVLCRLISGGPNGRDLPQAGYRFQFDVIAPTRTSASIIAYTLLSELNWLGQGEPGPVLLGTYLAAGSAVSIRWLPDPDSDVPRYIVDALITTVL